MCYWFALLYCVCNVLRTWFMTVITEVAGACLCPGCIRLSCLFFFFFFSSYYLLRWILLSCDSRFMMTWCWPCSHRNVILTHGISQLGTEKYALLFSPSFTLSTFEGNDSIKQTIYLSLVREFICLLSRARVEWRGQSVAISSYSLVSCQMGDNRPGQPYESATGRLRWEGKSNWYGS